MVKKNKGPRTVRMVKGPVDPLNPSAAFVNQMLDIDPVKKSREDAEGLYVQCRNLLAKSAGIKSAIVDPVVVDSEQAKDIATLSKRLALDLKKMHGDLMAIKERSDQVSSLKDIEAVEMYAAYSEVCLNYNTWIMNYHEIAFPLLGDITDLINKAVAATEKPKE